MGKFLKENWFVALVAVFFIAISVYFAYDQNKDKLPGKSVSGKDVVFSVAGENFTADDLYEELAKTNFDGEIYMSFYTTLLDQAVPTTDEMKTEAQQTVSYYVSIYQQYYGYGEEYLNYIAYYYYGYDTFYDYILYSQKAEQLYSEYITAHIEDYLTDEFMDEYKPRTISYVVITMDDPENPTAEEASKLKEAQDAWASDQYSAANFGEFAAAYSQDGNASNNGKLGYLDTATGNMDEAFTDVALELEEGEVSDWIYSEMYGYYLIKCDSTNPEDFKSESGFTSSILEASEGLDSKIILAKADEIGVKYGTEEIEQLIKSHLTDEDEDEGE